MVRRWSPVQFRSTAYKVTHEEKWVIFIYKRQAHQMTRLRLKWCRGAESNRAAEYYPGLANARMFPARIVCEQHTAVLCSHFGVMLAARWISVRPATSWSHLTYLPRRGATWGGIQSGISR